MVFRRLSTFSLLASALFTVIPALHARDELRFANGDRISGQVLSEENGVIRFNSPVLGELRVPVADVEVARNVADTPIEALAGLPPQQPAATTALPPASPTTPPSPPPPAAPVVQVRPAPPAAAKAAAQATAAKDANRWKGKMEAGYIQASGRSNRVDISFRTEAEKRLDQKNRLRGEGRILYAKSTNRVTSDRKDGLVRWRRDLNERMFGQVQASAYVDDVKLIDINAEQNFGLGYKLLDRPRHVLNAGTGLTAQYRESPRTTDGWAYLVEAFQDYTFRLNGRLTLTQNFNAFYSPPELGQRNLVSNGSSGQEPGNYRIRFNATLQGKVSEKISMNLRFEFEHDATIGNPQLRDDQRITSSIGYAF